MSIQNFKQRLLICAVIAIISIGLGVYNVSYSPDYNTINIVLQSVIAAAGFSAISEIVAITGKSAVPAYVITATILSVIATIFTPWNIILPRADFATDTIELAHHSAVLSCLVSYSAAFVVSVLVGVFVLHRREVFRSRQS